MEAVHLNPAPGGTRLRIRATPGARREAILGVHDGSLRVAVRAVAEKGRANDALTRFIAKTLAVPPSDVAVVAGRASREKSVIVRGLTPAEVRVRLDAALA